MGVGSLLIALILAIPLVADSSAQRRSSTRTADVELKCPALLGHGATTGRPYCDVQIGVDPEVGAIAEIPPHRGTARLTFDLHNRHLYSATLEKSGNAYARATATIGVLTLDGRLLTRAIVRTEFRQASDLLERITGGAGESGLKAVAPVGAQPVTVEIPADVDAVSVLGEKLMVLRVGGEETYVAPGRPIALVSNVKIEYRPARR
jgi:hypothetical protein